ncbi:hypothetical protein [Aestuariimicrobium ganziense]|uniref:hypothetical protein n=1 Tax=Aestuariimicrobium ganziense TaxID=2773677 RepID=UPI002E2C74C7|nr:hypothetical protein [Aestuariimicrobium ganziense]
MTQAPTPSGPWPAIGHALTGEWLAAGDDQPLAADLVADWLKRVGWDAVRLREHRQVLQQAELPWPHPVPADCRGGLGAAQFHALLAGVRAACGVDGLQATRREGPVVLGPAERRLLDEVPPHHG